MIVSAGEMLAKRTFTVYVKDEESLPKFLS